LFRCAATNSQHRTWPVLQSLVASLVLSRLDYGSATLAGLRSHLLDRPQSMLNAVARLVFSAQKYDHITPLLRDLHWLPVPQRASRSVWRPSCIVARTDWRHHISRLSSDVSRTSTREDGCGRHRRRHSLFQRRGAQPSATALSKSPPRASGTACHNQLHILVVVTLKRRLKTELFRRSSGVTP
jgi:hypothetical protein